MRKLVTRHASVRSVALSIPGLFLMVLAASAEPSVVWQIGKFDEASLEFRTGLATDPAAAVMSPDKFPVFVVGQSDPAKDWYAYQPGTSNGKAGFRAHPFSVRFELPQAPRGLYTLKLALLAYTPRLPVLEVSVNGHRGRFFQHPVLIYSGGNIANHFLPQYSKAEIALDVPTGFLRQGTNTFVFTAIDDPGERDDSRGAVAVIGNSGITYDALALEHDPARSFSPEAVSALILPTVFYKTRGPGLVEMVDVFVRYNQPLREGRVALSLGPARLEQDLARGMEFGEQRLRFEAPEFTASTRAEATVSVNGRPSRFPATVTPGKKWNVFVVPHQHIDIGYTDYPPKVAEIQSRAIDEAIDMIREHPDFRYTLDAYWDLEQFLAGRSDGQIQECLRLIREKKILLPANYAGNYTGLPSLETQLRSFYHSYKFTRENGGDFDHSIITDIPTHSWSYPSIMASAGLKYLLLPANNMMGPNLLYGRMHEKSPFWWEGPDGQRVLTWYSRHYHQVATMFGLPPRPEAIHDTLPTFLQIYTRPEYKSDAVMIFGSQWENTDLYREHASMVSGWNKLYAFPKLKNTGVAEALGYIAEQFGDSIPVVRGDGGPYWDRGGGAQPGLVRENSHRVLAAEKFSTVSSLVNTRVWPDRPALDLLWRGLLSADEHTNGGGRDPEIRARHAKPPVNAENTRLLEHVLMRSLSALADAIPVPLGDVIVFNPLNWRRSKLVEFTLPRDRELVDRATGQAAPLEEMASSPLAAGSTRGGGTRRVRFLADVPALGYRCYTIRAARPEAQPPAAAGGKVLENSFYRVTLDPATGAIGSVFDKELNREMVDAASPYRFNHYIAAIGTQLPLSGQGLNTAVVPPPNFQVVGAGGGRVVSVDKTPFGMAARLEASGPGGARIASEILLYDGQKRIDINNQVQRDPGAAGGPGPVSAMYFAFPFAMDRPRFRFEIQNGVVDPAKDVLPGGAREWSIVQHWAAVDQEDVTAAIVPLDAPVVTFGDIIRWRWPREFGERKAAIFSFLTGSRGGAAAETRFRYVFTSGRKLAPGALSRLGWDAMSPMEVNELAFEDKVGNPPRPLDAAQGSFLSIDHPGVVLVTWKRAEDGKGTILRFVEVNGQPAAVRAATPLLTLERGWLCNSVEANRRPIAVSAQTFHFDVKPFEIVTVRLEGTPRTPRFE